AAYVQRFQIDPVRRDTDRLRPPAAQLASLEQQITQREKGIADLRKQCDAIQQSNEMLFAQRQRLPALLIALADQRPEDLLVQKIEGEPGRPIIHGICLSE